MRRALLSLWEIEEIKNKNNLNKGFKKHRTFERIKRLMSEIKEENGRRFYSLDVNEPVIIGKTRAGDPLKVIESFDKTLIAYSESKAAKPLTSMPIVLLSGYLCFPNIWGQYVEKLRPYFNIIRIRTRGHFESELGQSNAKTYLDDCTIDLELIRRAENIDKMILIGHSMGGLISLNYTRIYGDEHLGSLILVSAPYGDPFKTTYFGNLKTLGAVADILMCLLQLLEIEKIKQGKLVNNEFVKRLSYSLITGTLFKNSLNGIEEEELEYLIKWGSTIPVETISIALRSMRKIDLFNHLHDITTPLLVISGLNDLIVHWSNGLRVVEEINKNKGNAEICFLPCGHMPMMEFPDAFLNITLKFLMENLNDLKNKEELKKLIEHDDNKHLFIPLQGLENEESTLNNQLVQ